MKGKSIQRAFRAHQLLDRALTSLLLDEINDSDVKQLMTDLEGIVSVDQSTIHRSILDGVDKYMKEKCADLSNVSKTCKLWVSYLEVLRIARDLVAADRSGNWLDHLASVKACLPLFAASGHSNYLKSAYLYLQKMNDIPKTNPVVHRLFLNGLNVIRRTDKAWAGSGCDLAIEQCFMRSLKTSGGLTRGSGMSASQRDVWTMSMPIMAEMNLTMQDFTGTAYETSVQHKDLAPTRVDRDDGYQSKLRHKLVSCSPFTVDDSELRNVVTGQVDVSQWKEKGLKLSSDSKVKILYAL